MAWRWVRGRAPARVYGSTGASCVFVFHTKRVERAAGGGISVVHLPLNDSDPYGLVDYAGSVSASTTIRGGLTRSCAKFRSR